MINDEYYGTDDKDLIGNNDEADWILGPHDHESAAEQLVEEKDSDWEYPEQCIVWVWPAENPSDVKRFVVYREMRAHFSARELSPEEKP